MTLRLKVLLLSILPLILCALITAQLLRTQAAELTERQIATIEENLMRSKQQELVNYMNLAMTAVEPIYRNAQPDDTVSQTRARYILDRMRFDDDGYFFVYRYDGTNVVHPKQPFRIGQNWIDLEDPNGKPVIRDLIAAAQSGGGFVPYVWEQPSKGQLAEKLSYAVGLEKWGWMIGTGHYLGEIRDQMSGVRTEVEAGIDDVFLLITIITLTAVAIVFATGLLIQMRERKISDTQLRALTVRVIETQEEERARVARELHDGINQILVSARFALERAIFAAKRGAKDDEAALNDALDRLGLATKEVRRISRDLRPSVLDDLGLVAALESLVEDVEKRTGIEIDFDADAPGSGLCTEVKTALYRVAQEALTNVERHANASAVRLRLIKRGRGVILTIADDGKGELAGKNGGLGLRNMRERMEGVGGELVIRARRGFGLTIEARAPSTARAPSPLGLPDPAYA